ncbi:MAG: hypothetical protein A3F09_05310 [Chlamydiae bacterium RIFCSPHIGHO2_12_FULL_49_11]|nr:MAG: hypothetical protein A3F09_05310 [Chlamydiae bacterium RIFCSPHIGHO2_12_FULL_49_11]
MPYVVALDAGTSSCRAVLVDSFGKIAGYEQLSFTSHHPLPGAVEQNPLEIVKALKSCIFKLVDKNRINPVEILAIGITNQRETVVAWNKQTGLPIHPAIVWNDRRELAVLETLQNQEREVRAKTGLSLHPYFSAGKLWWILQNVPNAKKLLKEEKLLVGTMGTWILSKLAIGSPHLIDESNAARTLLFNTKTLDWDNELLNMFSIPRSILPEIRPTSTFFGMLDPEIVGKEIPILCMMGDQSASLFGHTCFEKYDTKITLGTGAFLLSNTKEERYAPQKGILSSIGWHIENEPVNYMVEGVVFAAGSAAIWLRDYLGLIIEAEETESLAYSVRDNGGIIFVPSFQGMGAPYNIAEARGMLLNLSLSTNIGHIVRALLEGIAHEVADIVEILRKDLRIPIRQLRAGGGMSYNNFLLQTAADMLDLSFSRSTIREATAIGVAFAAGLQAGFWKSQKEIATLWSADQKFEPEITPEVREAQRKKWQRASMLNQTWNNE